MLTCMCTAPLSLTQPHPASVLRLRSHNLPGVCSETQAKLEPIELNSFQEPLAKSFAMRQLHHMQQGNMSRKQAFDLTEAELKDKLQQLRR